MGWRGYKNGRLLAAAAAEFDAFITADKNIPYQKNFNTLPMAVVALEAPSNELPRLLPLLPKLERTLSGLAPRSVARVGNQH